MWRFLFCSLVQRLYSFLMRSIQSQTGQKPGQKPPTRHAQSLVKDKNKVLLCLRKSIKYKHHERYVRQCLWSKVRTLSCFKKFQKVFVWFLLNLLCYSARCTVSNRFYKGFESRIQLGNLSYSFQNVKENKMMMVMMMLMTMMMRNTHTCMAEMADPARPRTARYSE